jgi:anti-anti-sigma factor
MRVAVTTTAAEVWVHIIGEIDLSNRDHLRTALSAIDYQSARGVHIDLLRLTFCDTSACRVILRFERKVRLAGHPTEIWVTNPAIRKLIVILDPCAGPVEMSGPALRFEAADHG